MNIIVIGAGNLGRRHLQSLLSVKGSVNIYVYDPSEESIAQAQQIVSAQSHTHTVQFVTDFNTIPDNTFLAVIATSSMHRKDAVEQLLKHSKVENLVLEKFLFTKLADFEEVQNWLTKAGVQCWVNCARRMFPFYSRLVKAIEGPVNLNVYGSNWGLACNSIHFLDLHFFLSKRPDLTYEVDLSRVADKLYSSRRAGYTEFMGDIRLYGSDGSLINMSCSERGNVPVTVNLESASHKLYIHESVPGKVMWASRENNWEWETEDFNVPFQSQLTSKMAEEIMETGSCSLPSYAESAALHKILLEGWIEKSRAILATETIDECIIT